MPYLSCPRCFLTAYSESVPAAGEACPRCATALGLVAGGRFETTVGDGRVRLCFGRPATTALPPFPEAARTGR